MYQSDTEILYPMRVTPHLRNLRGELWRELVDQVRTLPPTSLDQLAFGLLLVRLSGCLTCHTHSYRALRGCTLCATHSVRRFRGDDTELLRLFEEARADVAKYLEEDPKDMRIVDTSLSGGKHG